MKTHAMKNKNAGFTLVEMAIVIIILGVTLAALTPLYTLYQKNKAIEKTQLDVNAVISAIGSFRSVNGRYPCPSSLTANRDDPNYGRELCADLSATAVGDCANGVCVERSTHAPIDFEYPKGTPKVNQVPRVLVGFVPFRHLNLEENFAYDGYGSRLMYVITEHLTCDECFKADQGAIEIVDNSGTSVLSTPATAHFLVFSYGQNNAGAYTKNGVRIACAADGLENENCDYDSNAASADAIYQVAAANTSQDDGAYDDVVNYFVQDEIPLWQMSTAQDYAIQQKPGGNLGIKINPEDIDARAEVSGSVRAQTDPLEEDSGKIRTSELCNIGGDDCFKISLITGDIAIDEPEMGLECPGDDPDGTGKYMVAIKDNHPVCEDKLVDDCETGLAIGADDDGKLKCAAQGCESQNVSLCPSVTSLIPPDKDGAVYTVKVGDSYSQKYVCKNQTWVKKGKSSGVCSCTPKVVNTTGNCDAGYTGTQTTTVTTVCPSGKKTTTSDTSACVCNSGPDYGTRNCPPGHDGEILTRRTHLCPSGAWTPWEDVPGGDSCNCENRDETQKLSCPDNKVGEITQTRTITCTKEGVEIGEWEESANTCKCVVKTQQDMDTDACPKGQIGYVLKERTLNCNQEGKGEWSKWEIVQNKCKPQPPVYCTWNPGGIVQMGSNFPAGQYAGNDCTCGKIKSCYTKNSGTFNNYSACECK